MPDITELADFDMLKKIPSWAEIRIGQGLFVFYNSKYQLHVAVELSKLTPNIIAPMLNNLGGAIFEREHPDTYLPLIRREAEIVVAGGELNAEDKRLKQRIRDLSFAAV